jgi:hypothetical protein
MPFDGYTTAQGLVVQDSQSARHRIGLGGAKVKVTRDNINNLTYIFNDHCRIMIIGEKNPKTSRRVYEGGKHVSVFDDEVMPETWRSYFIAQDDLLYDTMMEEDFEITPPGYMHAFSALVGFPEELIFSSDYTPSTAVSVNLAGNDPAIAIAGKDSSTELHAEDLDIGELKTKLQFLGLESNVVPEQEPFILLRGLWPDTIPNWPDLDFMEETESCLSKTLLGRLFESFHSAIHCTTIFDMAKPRSEMIILQPTSSPAWQRWKHGSNVDLPRKPRRFPLDRLPHEIQVMIWDLCLPEESRTLRVEIYLSHKRKDGMLYRFRTKDKPSPFSFQFGTCARYAYLKSYTGTLESGPLDQLIRFHPDQDTIHFWHSSEIYKIAAVDRLSRRSGAYKRKIKNTLTRKIKNVTFDCFEPMLEKPTLKGGFSVYRHLQSLQRANILLTRESKDTILIRRRNDPYLPPFIEEDINMHSAASVEERSEMRIAWNLALRHWRRPYNPGGYQRHWVYPKLCVPLYRSASQPNIFPLSLYD